MKYICLSFDDGRSDTFEYSFPVLKKYGLKATVNIISDFVVNPQNYSFSSGPKPMNIMQIKEWQATGFEVACHGSTHINTAEDVINNIEELETFGIDVHNIGFASPESYLTQGNIHETGIDTLKKNEKISYIRTGIQIRREGLLYTIMSVLEQITHSSNLYYYLNKRNILETNYFPEILPSAAIKDYTTCSQVIDFINRMKDNQAIIFMFHSILPESDSSFGKDHYYWAYDRFDELCKWMSSKKELRVLTTYELLFGED